MTYEELLINIELNGYENVLPKASRKCLYDNHRFVVCDDGDCHLFDKYGREDDISKVKTIYEDMIPKAIKKIVIPNSVTSIKRFALSWCNGLMSITIPKSAMNIGSYAFEGCSKLENMMIPNSVTNIGYWTFYNCHNLKSLIFKGKSFDQVKSMKNYPFGIEDESIIHCM